MFIPFYSATHVEYIVAYILQTHTLRHSQFCPISWRRCLFLLYYIVQYPQCTIVVSSVVTAVSLNLHVF